MVDEIDAVNEQNELECQLLVGAASQAVADMPVGEAGDCVGCNGYFTRLVGNHCGRCRDRLGLP